MVQDQLVCKKQQCFSYKQYRHFMHQLVEEGQTSGKEQSESLINLTLLNDRRMRRWEKTVHLAEDIRVRLSQFKGKVIWVVIAESWCADGAHMLPIMQKIAEQSDRIDLRIVLRDENETFMNQFLTNGGRAIPKLVMIDNETKAVMETYGPRPSAVTKIVEEFKQTYGKLTLEFKVDLQRWYNNDKGQTIIEDLLNLLGV